MLLIILYIILFLLLLLLFWPHRFEGYYSGETWFMEWRAYLFKWYISPNGISYSFLKWKLSDSTEGEEEGLSDEGFEDPDFEPDFIKPKVKSKADSPKEEKSASPTPPKSEPVEYKKDKTPTTVTVTETKSKAVESDEAAIERSIENTIDSDEDAIERSIEDTIEQKVETFFEQPSPSKDEWWDDEAEEAEEDEEGFSINKIKNKIQEWRELWEGYRKDIIKLLKWCKLFVIYFVKVIKPSILQVSVHGGLDNPADTGQFYAWFTNTFAVMPMSKWFYIHFIPLFGDDQEWRLDAKALYKFNLLQVLVVLLIVVVTFPYFAYKRVKRKYKGEDVETETATVKA